MTKLFDTKAHGGPYIMGVINVTPDSFSDGGRFAGHEQAIAHGLQLAAEGADILDIGGESTRPGAAPVTPQEEMARILPVIEGLKNCGKMISVDTRNAETMIAAAKAGAGMINDVTALEGEGSLEAAAATGMPVCLMHMQGKPQTMQDSPQYDDVVADITAYLAARIEACIQAGIAKEKIVVDPGVGFGKTLQHNLEIIKNAAAFRALDVPVLFGLSRKSFIEKICPDTPADQRFPGSIAAALWAAQQGVEIFRVHDVAATKQAFSVMAALAAA